MEDSAIRFNKYLHLSDMKNETIEHIVNSFCP
jgi:hypothetical protein